KTHRCLPSAGRDGRHSRQDQIAELCCPSPQWHRLLSTLPELGGALRQRRSLPSVPATTSQGLLASPAIAPKARPKRLGKRSPRGPLPPHLAGSQASNLCLPRQGTTAESQDSHSRNRRERFTSCGPQCCTGSERSRSEQHCSTALFIHVPHWIDIRDDSSQNHSLARSRRM